MYCYGRMVFSLNPAQHNQMLHNGYLLVELRRSVYALLEGSGLHVAFRDNVLLTCTSIIRFYFFFVARTDDIPSTYLLSHVSTSPTPYTYPYSDYEW